MHIFASDNTVREQQRAAGRNKEIPPTAADLRREHIENEREVREHARWRSLAYALFVAPVIVWLAYAIVAWITAPL